MNVVIQKAGETCAFRVGEIDVGRPVGRQLLFVGEVRGVDAGILVVFIEHPEAGEEREGSRRHRRGRQDVRPGGRRRPEQTLEKGGGEVALLLQAVGGHGAHLGQHVLARVEDARARADDRLAGSLDVPREAEARLKLHRLVRNPAV